VTLCGQIIIFRAKTTYTKAKELFCGPCTLTFASKLFALEQNIRLRGQIISLLRETSRTNEKSGSLRPKQLTSWPKPFFSGQVLAWIGLNHFSFAQV
jgi:hypothetical protein